MQEQLSESAGEYIHYGMASQDILDTAMILQLRQAHQIVDSSLQKKLPKNLLKLRKNTKKRLLWDVDMAGIHRLLQLAFAQL